MVGKKKILAESFREMVWSELERKLTEEPAEQEGRFYLFYLFNHFTLLPSF